MTRHGRRWVSSTVVALGAGALLGLGWALAAVPTPANAHPLGNFSVNQLAALALYPDRIEVEAVVDLAELPTLQNRPLVDVTGDGVVDPAERAGHAGRECAAVARDLHVSVAGRRLVWTVLRHEFSYADGAAGLSTSRLACGLTDEASLAAPATVEIANTFAADRVGWRELTAVGHGVGLVDSPLPAGSISGGLRAYPQDLLTSPLDVRGARLRVEPGAPGRPNVTAAAAGPASVARDSGWSGWVGRAELALRGLLESRRLTPLVGVLAMLLALVLGAAHAALPGHGKTVMAAYLAGRSGQPRDAVAVGAVVTLTHTGGVLVLGLLLTAVAGLAGEIVLGWLGAASGALVAAIGAGMLASARRHRRWIARGHARSQRRGGHDNHDDDHGHHHPNARHHAGAEHGHGEDGRHTAGEHGHGRHGHHHAGAEHAHGGHRHDHGRPGRLSILGIGVAGGLVPSPSALVILLGAIALGRTGFGIALVLGYGVGMAATLTAAGLLLIRLRDRWLGRGRSPSRRWVRSAARLSAAAPAATASLVLLVGLGLAGRAVAAVV